MSVNVSITQAITSVKVINDGALTKTDDSPAKLTWNGAVVFKDATKTVVDIAPIRQVIIDYKDMLVEDLDSTAQSLYSKTYDNCTGAEAKAVRHKVLGDTWKVKIKALTNITISDSDADSLVDEILANCSV